MRKKFVLFFVCISLMATALLSGCGKGASRPMPDMSGMGDVDVVVREDGSGTRAEFEALSGSSETGADQIAASTHNPLTDITPEQLCAIYDGKTARWSDMK